MNEATESIRQHHRRLAGLLAEHVEAVSEPPPDVRYDELRLFLQQQLLPHAAAEEAHLYPALEPVIAKYGRATDTMSVEHDIIKRYVGDIEEILYELETGAAEDESCRLRALRRKILQLQAILALHLEKEERVYLPLFSRHIPSGEQRRIVAEMEPQHAVDFFYARLGP
jgi:hemerythrin-like domain-containing protein